MDEPGAACGLTTEDGVVVERTCTGELGCTFERTCGLWDAPLNLPQTREGAACDVWDPAQGGYKFCAPRARLSCENGRCAPWGSGELGSSCPTDMVQLSCNPGLRCSDDRVCVATSLGSPCVYDWHCDSEACVGEVCVTKVDACAH